jgi:hypothetical protein
VPAYDSSNPSHPPRIAAAAAIRGLRRVVVVAPSLAILLVLAAAGAASAADGLDLVGATPVAPVVPSVDPKSGAAPIVARLPSVKDRVAKTAERALPDGPARVVKAIVRGAEDKVDSAAPVPVPVAIPLGVDRSPGDVVQPRRADSSAADAKPVAGLSEAITTLLIRDQASLHEASKASPLGGDQGLPMRQPASPLVPLDSSGTGSVAGSDAGPGPWVRHGSWPGVPSAWRSGFPLTNTFTVPRGLTPRPQVPPG